MSGGEQRPVSGSQSETGRQFGLNRREYLGAVTGLAVATAGCFHDDDDDGIEESDWNTIRGDVARSGVTTAEAGPGESLSVAWDRDDSDLIGEIEGGEFLFPPGGEFSEPILYDDYCIYLFKYRAFPADSDDFVERVYAVALSQEDGSLVWRQRFLEGQEASEYRISSPEVADGSVYVPSPGTVDDPFIDVLDAASGEYRGRIELDRALSGSAIDDGTLYGVQRGRFFALDLADESTTWEVDEEPSDGSPTLVTLTDDRMVYTRGTTIAARDIETGELEWQTADLNGRQIMAGDDMGYIHVRGASFYQESLVAFDLADGTVQWEFTAESYTGPDGQTEHRVGWLPVVVDDLVLTAGSSGVTRSDRLSWDLYALDSDDGTVEWSVDLGTNWTAPVAAGEMVYVGTKAISTDGEELDAVDAKDRLTGYPAVRNGRIYSSGARDRDHERLVALE